MPDVIDQLRGYHDALAATVEPITAAEAMTTAAPPSPEARDRRAKWHWRIAAAAAAALVIVVSTIAVLGAPGSMPWVTANGADALRGRTFHAVSVTDRGGAPEPAVGSLTFVGDQVDLYDGCNSVSAPYTIEQGLLVVGSGVSTAMNCNQDGTGPDRWTRILASAAVALDGDRLTLSDDTISVELVEQASSPPPGTAFDATTTIVVADGPTSTSAEPGEGEYPDPDPRSSVQLEVQHTGILSGDEVDVWVWQGSSDPLPPGVPPHWLMVMWRVPFEIVDAGSPSDDGSANSSIVSIRMAPSTAGELAQAAQAERVAVTVPGADDQPCVPHALDCPNAPTFQPDG